MELMEHGMNYVQFPNQLNLAQIYMQKYNYIAKCLLLTPHLEEAKGDVFSSGSGYVVLDSVPSCNLF